MASAGRTSLIGSAVTIVTTGRAQCAAAANFCSPPAQPWPWPDAPPRRPPLPPASPLPAPPPGPSANERLSKLLDAFFEEALDDAPELVTQLGLDKGARADAKRRLSDASLADLEKDRALTASQLARMKAIDRSQLTGMSAINYDAVIFGIANTEANKRFKYGPEGAGQPYVLS